jgi:transcriptional regulator with XRE-family HTH domain
MQAHDSIVWQGQICPMPANLPKPSHVPLFLKEHREACGLTQAQVAEGLNDILGEVRFAGNDISRFERGRRGVSPDNLRLLAQVLNTTVARLHEPPRQRDLNRILEGKPDELWSQAERLLQALVGPGETK